MERSVYSDMVFVEAMAKFGYMSKAGKFLKVKIYSGCLCFFTIKDHTLEIFKEAACRIVFIFSF